jgi:hypothetical protein
VFYTSKKEKKTDEIIFTQSGLKIRNDCKAGKWKFGDNDFIEGDLEIVILGLNELEGAIRGSETVHNWSQIWFIGAPFETKIPKNIICCTLLKKASMENLKASILRNYHNDAENLIWCPKFQQKGTVIEGKPATYYILKWDVRHRTNEEKPQIKLCEDFVKKGIELIDNDCPIIQLPPLLASPIPKELKQAINI